MALTISPLLLPDGAIGVPYSVQLVVSGGIGPIRFFLIGGSFPPGLSMTQAGLISGTPTGIANLASVTILALDLNNCPGTFFFTLHIDDIGTGGPCPPCTTLDAATALLASRLEDPTYVHWTQAELVRYLREAIRTWNALTSTYHNQAVFLSRQGEAFYDLPVEIPALRAYNVTDADLVMDIEYALMETINTAAWGGTIQFTFPDVVMALQQARDRFLYESGMVVTRFFQPIPAPNVDGRYPIDPMIMTLRRVAFVPPSGEAYPLTRDDEWALQAFNRTWPAQTGIPTTQGPAPIVYSTGVVPPLTVQVAPTPQPAPVGSGTLDILAIARSTVMGANGPCLDPAQGVFLGIPDDWTWVARFGAMAVLLSQEGLAHDPQRAAYCMARFRHGLQLAAQSATVLAARVNGQPVQPASVSDADAFTRSWQSTLGTPAGVILSGGNVVGLTPPPVAGNDIITLDVVANIPVPANGADCLIVGDWVLDAILDYALHLAMFKEGPVQLQQTMGLLARFFDAAGVTLSVDTASAPNMGAIRGQTTQDERALTRMIFPPPGPTGTASRTTPSTPDPGTAP